MFFTLVKVGCDLGSEFSIYSSKESRYSQVSQSSIHKMLLFSSYRFDSFFISGSIVCQAPLCIRFPRQENWSGLPCPPSRGLPDSGIKLRSPSLVGVFVTTEPPGKPIHKINACLLLRESRDFLFLFFSLGNFSVQWAQQ